jgi:hypothetical protein
VPTESVLCPLASGPVSRLCVRPYGGAGRSLPSMGAGPLRFSHEVPSLGGSIEHGQTTMPTDRPSTSPRLFFPVTVIIRFYMKKPPFRGLCPIRFDLSEIV